MNWGRLQGHRVPLTFGLALKCPFERRRALVKRAVSRRALVKRAVSRRALAKRTVTVIRRALWSKRQSAGWYSSEG